MSEFNEPWKIIGEGHEDAALVDDKGECIAGHSSDEGAFSANDPNYRRIVACVNACADLETEDIETIGVWLKTDDL